MLLATLSNITKRFDDQLIIENGSFSMQEGQKVGLVGSNGTGKTTLFRMIVGEIRPDSGSIDFKKGIKTGTVAQELHHELEFSLRDFCYMTHPKVNDVRMQIAKLEPSIAEQNPPDEIVNEYHALTQEYTELGGYRFETEVKLVLEGIGFSRTQMNRQLASFSGGERNRAQIAAVLLGDYDFLLLDEPTNHLDIQATIWLENHIAGSNKAFLIISHDRRFLQNTTEKIVELSMGRLDIYHCRYDKYIKERSKKLDVAEHHFRHQQEEIARIEDFIRRNMAGQKTKQAQSKQKYLARMKKLERPVKENNKPAFRIVDGGRSFKQVIKVDDLTIGYDSFPLVRDTDFELTRGDRVGLIGPNGCGKTTLLKTLGGLMEPISGDITIGGNVDVAYFDQELSNLNSQSDVLSEVWDIDPLAESGRIRSFLARFGFSGEDVFKPVSLLSGGEKTKLSLAKILYRPANLMIFDEPTNHLDIESIEALEQGLNEYPGTLLVVSHDRDFLDKVVNQIFDISHEHIRRYLGNYSYYAEKTQVNLNPMKTVSAEKKASYERFKERGRVMGRYKKRLKQLTEMITNGEKRLKEMERDELVVDASNWERLNEIAQSKRSLEEDILGWYIEKEQLELEPPLD
ncbi:MAG: ABC-F family ATP-binding cassette domain-containing protein [candidate division Zixibacteria bacterium]|nr:ABC-F family ATP-binding cassette domain-containing protein [candidate division Zixibacteria bacterium]